MNQIASDFSPDSIPPPEPDAAESISVTATRKLTSRQTRAIEALMSSPSITAAAKASGISASTIHRWLRDDVFQNSYLESRRRSFAQAIVISQKSAPVVIAALLRIVMNTKGRGKSRESDQIAACKLLLKYARDSIEIDDIALRLQRLEDGN
jgi:hypothetical protein